MQLDRARIVAEQLERVGRRQERLLSQRSVLALGGIVVLAILVTALPVSGLISLGGYIGDRWEGTNAWVFAITAVIIGTGIFEGFRRLLRALRKIIQGDETPKAD